MVWGRPQGRPQGSLHHAVCPHSHPQLPRVPLASEEVTRLGRDSEATPMSQLWPRQPCSGSEGTDSWLTRPALQDSTCMHLALFLLSLFSFLSVTVIFYSSDMDTDAV